LDLVGKAGVKIILPSAANIIHAKIVNRTRRTQGNSNQTKRKSLTYLSLC